MNEIHVKTTLELTSKTVGYCICGEKTCFEDCEVCEILLNDKSKNKSNSDVTSKNKK
jgi:hypothetical protein